MVDGVTLGQVKVVEEARVAVAAGFAVDAKFARVAVMAGFAVVVMAASAAVIVALGCIGTPYTMVDSLKMTSQVLKAVDNPTERNLESTI